MGIVKEKDDVYGRCGKKKGRQCPRSQGSSVSSFACTLRLEDLIIRLISMPVIRSKLESTGLRGSSVWPARFPRARSGWSWHGLSFTKRNYSPTGGHCRMGGLRLKLSRSEERRVGEEGR